MTSLFSSTKAQPAQAAPPQAPLVAAAAPPPVAPAPVIMPTMNSNAVTQSQQDQLRASAARSGRASTILSQNDISKTDSLG